MTDCQILLKMSNKKFVTRLFLQDKATEIQEKQEEGMLRHG